MEFYKTIKNIASTGAKIAIVAALPYLCNDGCAYSGNKASAAEVRQEVRAPVMESENLEIILEK